MWQDPESFPVLYGLLLGHSLGQRHSVGQFSASFLGDEDLREERPLGASPGRPDPHLSTGRAGVDAVGRLG